MDPSQYHVQARRVSSVKSTSQKFPVLVSAKQRENVDSILVFDPSEISSNSHLIVPIDTYLSILFLFDLIALFYSQKIYVIPRLSNKFTYVLNSSIQKYSM